MNVLCLPEKGTSITSKNKGPISEVLQQRANIEGQCHLVLIHGIADSSDVWRNVCTYLPACFKSFQELNLPWNIAEGDPISYQPAPEDILRDAWQQLPDGPKVVLAHSFGANSILAMLQKEPLFDVSALVMISVYSKPSYEDFTWSLFVRYIKEFDKFLTSSIDARPGSHSLSEASKKIVLDKTKEMYSPSSWIQFYVLFSQTPGLDLSSLTMPVLVVAGEKDFSIEQSDIAQFANRLVNSEFHCIEQCGHFAMLEQPEYTAKIIKEFLNKRKLL